MADWLFDSVIVPDRFVGLFHTFENVTENADASFRNTPMLPWLVTMLFVTVTVPADPAERMPYDPLLLIVQFVTASVRPLELGAK